MELDFSITTVKADVFKYLERSQEKFNIIFADPPYSFDQSQFLKIADLVFEGGLLEEDGLLVVEHSDQTDLTMHSNFSEHRKYGGSIFSFFQEGEIE